MGIKIRETFTAEQAAKRTVLSDNAQVLEEAKKLEVGGQFDMETDHPDPEKFVNSLRAYLNKDKIKKTIKVRVKKNGDTGTLTITREQPD